jgi:hypothetical protein
MCFYIESQVLNHEAHDSAIIYARGCSLNQYKTISLAAIILSASLLLVVTMPASESQTSNAFSTDVILSTGAMNAPSPTGTINDMPDDSVNAKGLAFGWGGYITDMNEVIPILDDLEADGYNAIRYWAAPYWYYGRSVCNLNFNLLDLLIEEAAKRRIIVYIDPEHNYPPSDFIIGHEEEWINDLMTVGKRYNDRSNVVLECVNEYTGDGQPALYNRATATLRSNGIHLPLLFNFWWNQRNVALNDPDNNYAIGRHLYGSSYDDYNPATPIALQDAVKTSGIAHAMYVYFEDPKQSLYFQEVTDLNIPNGWVITELGPTDDEKMVEDPSVGNIAYAMQFMREAAVHNVSVICYRIGEWSKKSLYEQRALEYFREGFFTPPEI